MNNNLKQMIMFVFMLTMVMGVSIETKAAITQDKAVYQYVNSYQSVLDSSKMKSKEYCRIEAKGSVLTLTGKTMTPAYKQFRFYIANKATSMSEFWQESRGTIQSDGTFTKSLDFGNGQHDKGDYVAYVRFSRDEEQKMNNMKKIFVRYDGQTVSILENKGVIAENNAMQNQGLPYPKYYLDTSLSDMSFEVRNGRTWTASDQKELTTEEIQYIKKISDKVVGNETDDYEKALLLHDYLVQNCYYDKVYNKADKAKKEEMAQKNLVTLNPYKLCKQIEASKSDSSIKPKTVCNGFAAAYTALMRAQGIPVRSVGGRSSGGKLWSEFTNEQLNTVTHIWNEVYIDGRWIFVDVNSDCPNDYELDKSYVNYSKNGVKQYYGFDMSPSSLAVDHLYLKYREEVKLKANPPVLNSIKSKSKPVALSWSRVNGAAGYSVYRGVKSSNVYKRIKKTTSLSYKDNDASYGVEYAYKVAAYDVNGIETELSLSKYAKPEIPVPTIKTLSIKSRKVTLTWNKVTGAKSYYVYRSKKSASGFQKVATIRDGKVSYRSQTLKKGTYYWRIVSVASNGSMSKKSSYRTSKIK